MRFDHRVVEAFVHGVETFVDVGGELFKPLVHVGSVIVESFVDVGGEVVESFVHGFEANIHGVLEPVNLRLDMHEPSACFGYETSEFGVGNKLFISRL